MARISRKDIGGKYFHIMVQGIAKESIFPDDNSKGYYLSCLRDGKDKASVKIFAFCVMSNHVHILLESDSISKLSSFMNSVNAKYAKYYNTINNRVGYVFRGRFKSEIIEEPKYLINCLAYIQNNPVKAGIVKNAQDYGHSSYTNYLTGLGIVDFKSAAKHYDIAASNIKAIMKEKSDSIWLEHDEMIYEPVDKVFDELIIRYKINKNNLDDDVIKKTAKELTERCGISLRKVANLLEIGRERVRRVIVNE
ncbi:MAG: transposase [Endomicrobia bacterium]|nr:transposase [Endomicrobiia bacterium]MCL2798694.1 transposase [Endomicrobiia bacterium]